MTASASPASAASSSPPAACARTPAPAAAPDQIESLRADLEASGWGVNSTRHLLGPVADDALHRELRLPALRAVRAVLAEDRAAGASPSPTAVLTALFMLGEPVSAADLDAVLRRTRTAGALAMGLVVAVGCDAVVNPQTQGTAGATGAETAGPGIGGAASPPATGSSAPAAVSSDVALSDPAVVRAAVDLRPHEVRDDAGDVRWWIASDLGELITGRELTPDHVLGIGGAGLTLAGLTPRDPVAAALDLGCGCGIQTLHLLRHAARVTATDISARALTFTAFNAALAGTDPDRLELLHGSLLEPLADRTFDLVVTNPPFVITPPAVREAGLPLMEYRDAGAPVLPALVAALGDHLRPGGTAVMLGNWEHRTGRDWRDEVRAWLPDGLDAWVIQRERQDPVEYATMWLRDGGTIPERDEAVFNTRLGPWIDDFAAPLGEHVARIVSTRSLLASLSDDEVAALHPVVADDVTRQDHRRPGDGDPALILIHQGGGFGRSRRADTALAALVDVSDGELSVAQIAAAVAALTDADRGAVRDELVAATRELAGKGFLTL